MFFFDEKLQLHINDTPLLISSKVLKAANDALVDLQWNVDGYVCAVSQVVAKAISKELGITMLSIAEFMDLEKREPRVASADFGEWFSDCFTLTNADQILDSDGKIVLVPVARPGWFFLDDVDDRGLPKKISKSPSINQWKFWTPGQVDCTFGGLRSFMTSSGTCSLDMGIPDFARHPMIMIRECYQLKAPKRERPIDSIWAEYESVTHERDDKAIRDFLISLQPDDLRPKNDVDEFLVKKENEMISDRAGKKRLLTGGYEDLQIVDCSTITNAL
jgi:hypothetical protein